MKECCDKEQCCEKTEPSLSHVKDISVSLPEKSSGNGVWLNAEEPLESVHIYVNTEAVVVGYNSPNMKENASKIALIFDKKGKIQLQFFKNGNINFANVNSNLVYDKLLNVLLDLEDKALKLNVTPEVK